MKHHRTEWALVLVLGASHSAQHFYSRVIPPLIPLLTVALQLPLWQLGLLMSAYALGSGFGQTPMGILSDKYDRRYLLPPGLALTASGYIIFALAPILGRALPSFTLAGHEFSGSFVSMGCAMLISGLGDSTIHPTGYPLISANVSRANKGKALGIWSSAAKLGDAAAPALVGTLIIVATWDQILLVLGILGLVYAAILFTVLSHDEFDTLPFRHASKVKDEMVPEPGFDMWKADRRTFIYPMLVVLLFFATRMIATKGVNTFVPVFITEVYGYSLNYRGLNLGPESFANFYFSALLFVAAIVQLVAGSLVDRYDHRKVLIGFLLITTVALAMLSYLTLSPLPLLFTLLAVGGGLWGLNPARDALISDIAPPEWEGRTFGYLWTVAQIIGSLS
ncbi:MAG: MFS transporter, partial [Chloroflexi bacterium]